MSIIKPAVTCAAFLSAVILMAIFCPKLLFIILLGVILVLTAE